MAHRIVYAKYYTFFCIEVKCILEIYGQNKWRALSWGDHPQKPVARLTFLPERAYNERVNEAAKGKNTYARDQQLILAWCELHRDELMQNWELAKDAKPLNHIAPLV